MLIVLHFGFHCYLGNARDFDDVVKGIWSLCEVMWTLRMALIDVCLCQWDWKDDEKKTFCRFM